MCIRDSLINYENQLNVDGESRVNSLSDVTNPETSKYVVTNIINDKYAVIDMPYKLISSAEGDQLFNILYDQSESTNIAQENQAIVSKLKNILSDEKLYIMPCCYDALSAKMIEQNDFKLSFMSGFATSASKLGIPDTGLISYGEIIEQGRNICENVEIPIIGDGDTGYGNELNVRRTVKGFYKAGFSAVMIEDQESPKRCGHTRGKKVVSREDATSRIKAAIEEKKSGSNILIMARTDARYEFGIEEAIDRLKIFRDLGADILLSLIHI